MKQFAIQLLAAGLLAAFVTSRPVHSQATPNTLDGGGRATIVENAARSLRERYVFPDIGEQAAARIETQSANGAYDALTTTDAFASQLTQDLQEVTHDKHLRAIAPRPTSTPGDRTERPSHEGGVVRADIINGDIGYIEITGFVALESFRPAIDRAMASLSDASAIVVDLRRNGGGDPQSVSYLVSHFLDGDDQTPVHVNDFVTRIHGTTDFDVREFWSSPTSTSLHGKALYVLTSDRTFSAAEEFSYDIKVMKLGLTVGDATGGGANPGGAVPIGESIRLFVPDGRARNPITGTNWEGVGVAPDIPVETHEALRAALEHAGRRPTASNIEALSLARVFTPETE